MKISFYIASKDYAMFIAGKEVELKTKYENRKL